MIAVENRVDTRFIRISYENFSDSLSLCIRCIFIVIMISEKFIFTIRIKNPYLNSTANIA